MDDFSQLGGLNHQRGGNEDYMYSFVLPPPSSSQSPLGSSGPPPPPPEADTIKARIVAHPNYPNLVGAYMNCCKVGAPPDVVAQLSTIAGELEHRQPLVACSSDPELDQFMEAYYHMLVKYREELARPLDEAADFLRKVESQLNSVSITDGSSRLCCFADLGKSGECLSEGYQLDCIAGETVAEVEADPMVDDRELKHHLFMKYSGYLSSLRQELSKKKKKSKLPKEARQKLLSWWELHQKWPYPSESEKVELVESTSLDQKQINNWFINQRKRHWKPPEDMQFMVLNGYHHQQNAASFYMDGRFVGDGSMYRLGP